ncbi:MAG: ATPase [Candidatus Nealsonbacteria bacterium CG08_land_8_20_14_0_20_38_20]|uniref:ATPase n=1 Tax=Candidatus Nealsonbacteria bacterium CG08_land_8_20_14_0_20_38_20 TaxID=1974705 RepID=A0A2H0YNW8_9BACT|nr:MAG: ATPase [Candidatus Nealsonbacteria bacterium CG08_land_8_20_14_0_20_38_20]
MDKKNTFKLIIKEFHESKLPEIKERDLGLPQKTNKIITLSGPRRAGKTYYFYQIIKKLKEKIDFSRIIYVDFEDDRLFPLAIKDLDDLMEAYFELYPENKAKEIYYFFDEIQNIDNWEIFIRRIYDKEKAKIFLTGSSSKLLSREIATSLRGRTLNYQIFPLSFKEFLNFKGVKPDKNSAYSKIRFQIKKLFQEYAIFGGFPEVVLESDDLKMAVLKNYYDLIIYRDLVERFAVRNVNFLKSLSKYLLTNVSAPFSINGYHQNLEKPLRPAKETVLEYLSYLQEIELVFLLPIFSYSLKTQQVNPKKNYVVDNGLRNAVCFRFSEDFGRLLENLVFVELKRRNKEIYYYKQKRECDFVVMNNLKASQAIQVTQELNKNNKEREVGGLIEVMRKYQIERGLVLVQDLKEETKEKINNKEIKFVSLWKWLLEEER